MTAIQPTQQRTRTSGRTWLGLAVVLTAVLMGQIDMFAVNVAAPAIQRELGASFGQLRLIVSGYVVAYAAGLIVGGRLGDRYGRRRVFIVGAAAFALTSLSCGLAGSGGVLIVARVAQGAAGAVLMPQVLSMIRANFTDAAERARAVGAYGSTIGLGVIAGLIGGGALQSADLLGMGWRAIFLINVPIGLIILILAPATVTESRDEATRRLDLVGALLGGLGLVCLLLPLSVDGQTGASTWLSVVAGIVLCAVFLGHQRAVARRGAEPIVPPRLFANRGFGLSMVTVVVFYAGNAGLFLVLTYHLQSGLQLGPLATGLVFTPLGVGFAVASAAGKRLAAAFGDRVAVLGAVLMTASLLLVPVVSATDTGTQAGALAAVLGVSGLGQGLVVARLLSTVLSLISVSDAGAGSGVLNTVLQTGMALGVTVVGAAYQAVLGGNPDAPSAALTVGDFGSALDVLALLLAGLAAATALLVHRLSRSGG